MKATSWMARNILTCDTNCLEVFITLADFGTTTYSSSSGPSIVPFRKCRLPAIVPVKPVGADGNNK